MGLLNILAKGVVITERPVATQKRTKPVIVEEETEYIEQVPELSAMEEEILPEDDLETRQEKAEAILYGYNTAAKTKLAPAAATYGGFDAAFGGQTLGNQNILVCTPKSHKEIAPILENLWNKNPCVVNLDDSDTPQRHLDFLQGFVTAIHGTIKQIDPDKLNFILTPNGVGVK